MKKYIQLANQKWCSKWCSITKDTLSNIEKWCSNGVVALKTHYQILKNGLK